MNDQPILNPKVKIRLQSFMASPSHAVILQGRSGSGKGYLAKYLAAKLLSIEPSQVESSESVRIISDRDERGQILIDDIRALDSFLSLKSTKTTAVNRVILILDAWLMNVTAQNALLKILEEPPSGTVIIMTTTSSEKLLKTIWSRAQKIVVLQLDPDQIKQYLLGQGFDPKRVEQAILISGGYIGLASSILTDEQSPMLVATQKAREILSANIFTKLCMIDKLSKDKLLCLNIMLVLQQMAEHSLVNSSIVKKEKWQSTLEASYQAADLLRQNVQAKLVLLDLMLKL